MYIGSYLFANGIRILLGIYTIKFIFVVRQIYFTRQDFDSNNGYGIILYGPCKLLPSKAFHWISQPQAEQ